MPEVTMSLEEYLALINQDGSFKQKRSADTITVKPKRVGKKDPKMARALKKANSIGRTKAGKLRTGYTQAKIMKKAHQLRRKM
tara:strand:+ start:184 stop:432 length:249 start_codon:yes stop_codon:yes gene_type:complete